MCSALRVGKTYQLAETFVASTRSRGKIPKKMHLKGKGEGQTICLKIYRLVLFACCLVFFVFWNFIVFICGISERGKLINKYAAYFCAFVNCFKFLKKRIYLSLSLQRD